jgi:chromosome segregation ATPase
MVDRGKLNKTAGGETASSATTGRSSEQIAEELKMIVDLPKIDSTGENSRAWVVRLIVSVFAVVALYVLYLAYAESAQLRTREAQLAAIEQSEQKAREDLAQLAGWISGMREESKTLSETVGKLTQEKNQLSVDLQDARKTITLATQRQTELDDASTRLSQMSAAISAATTRSSTVTREVQGLEYRYEAEQANLESLLESIIEYSQTLSEKQPLVDDVNRLKPERDALKKEVERLQLTVSKLMPLTGQVANLEDRKNRIEPTVAQLEIALKAAQTEFDNVRSQLGGEKIRLDEARRERAKVEGEVAGLSKEILMNQEALTSAKTDFTVTLTSIQSQEASKARLSEDVARLQANYEGLQAQITTSKAKIEAMRLQQNTLVSEISFTQGQRSVDQVDQSVVDESNKEEIN